MIKFFDNLRQSGIPVSLREYLTFLEALTKNIGTYEVENFYKEVLFTPFNFDISEEIDLDYENLEYADDFDELKTLWRKRLKL